MSSLACSGLFLFNLFSIVFVHSIKCNLVNDDISIDDIDEIFEDMSDDISETRLRHLLYKADSDNDGGLSADELKTWVKTVRQSHALKLSKERLAECDMNKDGEVSMSEYFDAFYGKDENLDVTTRDMVAQVKERDRIRWKFADFNQDGTLSPQEFAAFENPEDYEKMKEYNVEATFLALDTDKDGKVSMDEYLGSDVSSTVAADEVDFKKKYFKRLKDRNQDGYLDMVEVKKWLSRLYSSRIDLETNGFMKQMDGNTDGILDKDEIMNNLDQFNKEYPDLQHLLLEHDEL